MTRFDPSLRVERLRVERNGQAAYDERFHVGVNIIRGENSSGKSTILNLLYFGLGGDLKDWSETALLCTRTLVEVRLNGRVATLARDIVNAARQPMEVFSGTIDDAIRAPTADWQRYGYNRSTERESFSQILFRLLDFPEVTTEAAENVTFHQVLRLLYSDQLSPVDSIFKFEQFDPPTLREAVGRLLCGAFESELYTNELRVRSLTAEFEAASADLRSIFSVLGRADQSLEWIGAERSNLEKERVALQAEFESLEREIVEVADRDRLSLQGQGEIYTALQEAQRRIADVRSRRDSLALEIADSDAFIADLQAKLEALNDATAVTDVIDEVKFRVCPACYAVVESPAPAHACHLCKTPFDSGRARDRLVAMINDTATQLRQSRQLQAERLTRSGTLERELADSENVWRDLSQRFSAAQELPSTELRQRLNRIQRQMGYVDRQIEDLDEKQKLSSVIADLTARKDRLNEEIGRLRSRNETLRLSQSVRLASAYSEIADQVRYLLTHDLSRQDSFEDPRNIEIDFAGNRIKVDDHTYFSASSRVILRNSFFVGFFSAACADAAFRHPRFSMLDSIEDKGMEVERAHNFQQLIVALVEKARTECQVIFGTSMIDPSLETGDYVVGRHYTRESQTLEIR